MGRARHHRRAAPRSPRARDTRAARQAVPGRAGSRAAARRATRAVRHRRPAARRGARSLEDRARHAAGAAVPSPRLRNRAHDPAGYDARLRRHRQTDGLARLRARRGAGPRAQPVRDHRAVSPRARGRRQGRRLHGERRRHDEAPPAHARRRAAERAAESHEERERSRPRLRPRSGGRARARVRSDARARHRRRRAAAHGAPGDVERLRRARRSDRLPAADRQGGGDDLRARVRALPAHARRPAARADPAHLGREAPRRGTLAREGCSRCAISRAGPRAARSRSSRRCAAWRTPPSSSA